MQHGITALWGMSALISGRVSWLLDNSVSLHALIKGTSGTFICSQRSTWSKQVTPLARANSGMLA